MDRGIRIIGAILSVGLLVLVRVYASTLFYDPLINFFKNTHSMLPLPMFDWPGLLLNLGLRFWINSMISIFILWILFKNREIIQLSFIIYGFFFLLLMISFSILLLTYQQGAYMGLFYVRRFLIHPLLLLILIPGFYFYRNVK